jgi:signal transduction histidine kinase
LGLVKNEREKEKEITQFVAHDLRSPLSNILTSLKLLNEDEEEPPTENQKELIDLSISTGNRMLIFINSLLDLGRLEAKKLPLNIENIQVSKIIKAAVEQVALLAKEKRIEIKVDQNIDTMDADGNLLLRILVNLLSNAIKVSASETQVQVSVNQVDEKNILFSVKDQGPGFDKRLNKKLFRKYYQGSKIKAGSGIGLAFCKLAVETHLGHINIESIEGKGTTVSFVLPQSQ